MFLLRSVLGITGVVEGLHCVTGTPTLLWQCLGGVLAVSGTLVAMGLFTSFASVGLTLLATLLVFSIVPLPPFSLLDRPLGTAIVAVLGIAVALLGPGAFSLDFRFFGRREIIIPRDSSSDALRRSR